MRDVINNTEEFFRLHWNLNKQQPKWSDQYKLQGAVPNGDQPGCYALLENNNVVYIGLGASKGGGIYEEHGLGARLNSHVLVWDRSVSVPIAERRYKPKDKWQGITSIYTIGFPKDYGYLSSALEAFLIKNLSPAHNVTGRR